MQSSRMPPHLGRASAHSLVTAAVVEQLEQQQLSHSVPSRVSDHLCIRLVRLQRWLADKLLRERCIHRATMLHGVYASSAAAMGTYVRHSAMWARHNGGGGRKQQAPPSQAAEGTADTAGPAAGSDGSAAGVDHQLQPPPLSSSSTLSAAAAPMDSQEAPSSPNTSSSSSSSGRSWGFGPRMDALRACHSEQELHLRHFLCMKQLVRYSSAELAVHALVMGANYLVVLLLFAMSPRTAHRLMGYALEESAVVLTHMANDIDTAKVDDTAALPPQVLAYYTFVEAAAPAIVAGSAKPAAAGTVPRAAASVAVSASVAPNAVVGEGRSPDAMGAPAAAGAAPRVACLRTLALLMRSEHISLSERHHVRADELDEKRRSAGSGSSFA